MMELYYMPGACSLADQVVLEWVGARYETLGGLDGDRSQRLDQSEVVRATHARRRGRARGVVFRREDRHLTKTPMVQVEPPPASLLASDASAAAPPLYTATVAMATDQASQAQSHARAVSDDGALALVLRSPSEPGGRGGGTNAEQLFAAGLAASFHGALTMVALASGIRLEGRIGIVASVHLCRDLSEQGLFLAAELEVALPPMAREDAQSLMFEAERMCPYAKMARSGIRSTFILR